MHVGHWAACGWKMISHLWDLTFPSYAQNERKTYNVPASSQFGETSKVQNFITGNEELQERIFFINW